MESPYTPPESEDPGLIPRETGRGIRITVRILGMVAVLVATVLGNVLWKVEAMGSELGLFNSPSTRILSLLLLRHGGAVPFLGAVLLAGVGVILSFRDRARALPMLACVIASLLLTGISLVGLMFLISEFVRETGGA